MNFIAKHIQALGLLVLSAFIATAATVYWDLPTRLAKQKVSTPAAGYSCPMHPQIVSQRPGDCSICGMALTQAAAAKSDHKDCEHGTPGTGHQSATAGHAGCDHAESGGGCCGDKPKPMTNSLPTSGCTRSLYPVTATTPQ